MKLKWNTEKRKLNELIEYDKNPRQLNKKQKEDIKKSLKKFNLVEIPAINSNNILIAGHQRCKILSELEGPDFEIEVRVPNRELTDEEFQEYNIRSNKNTGDWDFDILKDAFNEEDLLDWGFDDLDFADGTDDDEIIKNKLRMSYVIPPFSILDTRQGYWQERKKLWKSLIKDEGESREYTLYKVQERKDFLRKRLGAGTTVSILDPVLSEISCKWFCVDKGSIIDPFAGDTVFGFVSSFLGNTFKGIELREEQTTLNNQRCKDYNLNAEYFCDDGQNVLKHIEENSQDMIFSCPPYYDLEVYSEDEKDASTQETYEDFIKILDNTFRDSIKCLKDDRFAVIVVGDIRNKKTGGYYGFPDDITRIFTKYGMMLYNSMILVETQGAAGLKTNSQMKNRKAVKTHQNVLVFYKDDKNNINKVFKSLDEERVISKAHENVLVFYKGDQKNIQSNFEDLSKLDNDWSEKIN